MGLDYEKRNGIAYLTLNRPEAHNSIDPELVVELSAAWEDYRDDNNMRCAIITGTGGKTFCSGADLGKLIPILTGAKKPESIAEKKLQADPFLPNKALLRDFKLYKPVIAAINGDAIAGGLELLYSTDIRITCQEARFGLQEVKWGIFPAGGSSVHLPRQIPYARAMEILLTGGLLKAQEAYNFGLVNRIVPQDKIMEEAERFAEIISKNGPLAVSAIKKSVLNNSGQSLEKALKTEIDLAIPVFLSKDAQEGPRAFKEKREPVFVGE